MTARSSSIVNGCAFFALLSVNTALIGDDGGDSRVEPLFSGKDVMVDSGSATDALLLPPPAYDVTVTGGVAIVYDSNTTQTADGEGAVLTLFDYGVHYELGDEADAGPFLALGYDGQAYVYEDAAAQAGRDPFQHRASARAGFNASKTKFAVVADYFRDNGNSVDSGRYGANEFGSYGREIRSLQSNSYNFDSTLIRQLPHGSVELGGGYWQREFDGQPAILNDASGYFGDLAWFYRPGFAKKIEAGVGLAAGTDDYETTGDQDFLTPSIRFRYRMSRKTSFYGSAGYEFRSIDGPDGVDSENFVFNTGASWSPTSKTSFDLSGYRSVQPSFVAFGENYEATGVLLRVTRSLPAQLRLISDVGFEHADYVSASGAPSSGREDDYFRFHLSLDRDLRLPGGLKGNASVFYNYNDNDSSLSSVEYDQHLSGVRFGVAF